MTKTTGAARALNVQVPGAAPKVQLETAKPGAAAGTENSAAAGAGTAPDLEAIRAQIRDEERANARAELASQMQTAVSAAGTVLGTSSALPAVSLSGLTKRDYANMRADDIDPATLTGPVLTLDGYLCPNPPEAKK